MNHLIRSIAFLSSGRMRRYPSPSLVVSITALVVALGGAGYSATGGNFILGRANTASTPSTLTAHVNGRALQLTNQVAAANATALGLTVAPGRPPMMVNSPVKVVNLNADRLDGLDSTQLPRSIVIPFNVAPGANTAPIALPANRAVFVMATTFGASVGVGQVTLLRTGFDIRWTGLETWAPAGAESIITSGATDEPGTHIVFIDNRWEVDIEVHDANSIRIHNGNSSVARTGHVTLIW
jgi:hypothetical protein